MKTLSTLLTTLRRSVPFSLRLQLAAWYTTVAESGREILVWGAGLHTQRLLATGGLDRANIRAFIDRDPIYHGATLAGRPIIAPEMPSFGSPESVPGPRSTPDSARREQ